MKFKLDLNIGALQNPISIKDAIVLFGSCFAENINQKLAQFKFNTLCNPNGILFNPISIANGLDAAINNNSNPDTLLFEHDGTWHSWWHHGSITGNSKEELDLAIQQANHATHAKLKDAQWLIMTWGSAYVYELAKNGLLVANCHKVPAGQFNKRLLSVDEITLAYPNLFDRLRKLNPTLKIMMSVSPVRYTRDGLHENNLSKSTLFLALNKLMELNKELIYFPAYEIVTDELRDYRFFDEDLVHPNKTAIDYVWQQFNETCLSADAHTWLKAIEPIIQARHHRPIHAHSKAHQQFKSDFLKKAQQLQNEYPVIDLSEEIEYFRS